MTDKHKVKTPIGDLMWLTISGRGKQNYSKDDFEYTASIIISKEDQGSEDFISFLDNIYLVESKSGATKQSPGYQVCDKDGTLNPEGDFFIIRFKTQVNFDDGGVKKIAVLLCICVGGI